MTTPPSPAAPLNALPLARLLGIEGVEASKAKVGTTVTAEATPVHVCRRSSVWQTRITAPDGKLLALVIQTQMVI